jgi:putative uncharacterized protein (fragment)
MAGWKEGSSEKVALHAIVGNISANMVNGNTNIGTAAGGLSELLAPAILEASHHDPARAQWLAYALGYATDKLVGGTGELGGSISHYGVKWNLLLNEHAKTIRQERYNAFIEKFKEQYREMEEEGNPYDEETINQAENDLWRVHYWNKKVKKLPQATELLGLFMEPENNQDIIEKSEEILPGFPLYVLNENSKVHQYLANNDELNKEIISKTILNTYMYDLPQLTHEGTISYYWKGVDEALAYGTASYIATYQIEGDLVYAKITIIDNWDHDKNESKVEFLEDAYILQQSKRKKIFAYKTTYDVAFKMDELMSIG